MIAAPDPLVPREPFARAHGARMARAQLGEREPRLADVDVWAEGTRLRARIRGEPGVFWIDGLSSGAVRVVDGKVAEPKRRTLEHALQLSLAASPSLSNRNTDRIAGHSCTIISEELPGGATLTRCIWRGLPLSVELSAKGFSFNAAATMVEEGAVNVADL
ncbi:MAG: hypothetical protein ACXWLM_06260, partial [Myxococcales bacterium]